MGKLVNQQFVLYASEDGEVKLNVILRDETVWLSQKMMSELFSVDRTVITKHLQNVFEVKELDEDSVSAKIAHTASDGKEYLTQFYNLDALISVGYRVNSVKATSFRKWATRTLRQYITDGYVIDRDRVGRNYQSFLRAVDEIKLLSSGRASESAELVDLVQAFANTWLSLDAYDRDALPQSGLSKQEVEVTAEELSVALDELKVALIESGEATELFAQPKHTDGLRGIIGNVFQTFGGDDVYPSVEEKAAHLLYFVVKNHVFNDGNKRSGAFCFVWYLQKAGVLRTDQMTPQALTSLTILIAESDPKHKDKVVGLVLMLLGAI